MTQGLPTTTLGRTRLKVTRLGFGAMELRGDESKGRTVAEDRAGKVLNALLDSGVNFIDTADCYGPSEEYIGKTISHRRSEFTLASKCGCTLAPRGKLWTQENLWEGLHRSLKRLKTDYLDVLQLHGGTPGDYEQGGLVAALEEMRKQGKVRWVGSSTVSPNLQTFIQWGVFDVFQVPYSAMARAHEGWIARASEAGMGTIIRGGVAKGEPGEGGGRAEAWKKYDDAKLDELRDEGESRTALMLRFTLSHPNVDTIIVGTQNPAHIEENARAARRGPLSDEVYAEAKRRLAAIGEKPEEA